MSGLANSVVDFDTDTIKLSLHSSAYVPSYTSHVWFSDVNSEVTGGGYTAGGTAIAGKTLTLNGGIVTFTGNQVLWTASTTGFTNARYGVIYKSTGVATTSRLIAIVDFGVDKTNVGGDFTVVWDATDIATWQ